MSSESNLSEEVKTLVVEPQTIHRQIDFNYQNMQRKGYSRDKLEKALADVRSGRIGTRRASVLYGIPRSTLRNKLLNSKLQNNKLEVDQKMRQESEAALTASNKNYSDYFLLNNNEQIRNFMSNINVKFMQDWLTMNQNESNAYLNFCLHQSQLLMQNYDTSIQNYLNTAIWKSLTEVLHKKTFENTQIEHSNSFKSSQLNDIVQIDKRSPLYSDEHKSHLKQKRAKRGQYRKYESDQLSKAVESVLKGKISVHKAGSHYGVPHSTLEYKVKEKTMKSNTMSESANSRASDSTSNSNSGKFSSKNNNLFENFLTSPFLKAF